MLKVLIEVIGWTAAAMMLAAYFLLTAGKLNSRSSSYQWLNLCSGAGIVVNSGWNGAYPSAFINVVWMAISLYGLLRVARATSAPAA
jgi:formate hydrogenlyase subunit 3/multisubunit Na+/H+ antiporter MnhD subunit